MLYAILAILALCALAILWPRPAPPTVIVVERMPASGGVGCGTALFVGIAVLAVLVLAS